MSLQQVLYKIENVTKAYGGRVILGIPEITFLRGQACALVGPNGSGKTTLLRLLAIIDRPTSGRITFDSVPLWNGSSRSTELARRITLVGHPPYLFNRSVAYNVGYGMKVRGVSRARIHEKTRDVLALVGLEGFEKREARRLSSGEQQRVALARALALEPQVLLLDEPTASIDRKHAQEVESIIRELGTRSGMTVIFSTHNHLQATALAQKVLSLFDGRVEQFAYENFFLGTPSESEGRFRIKIHPDIALKFSGGAQGPVHISIDPLNVVVSREPSPPARGNCFRGKLTGMTMHGSHVKLTMDIGVPLVSSVTADVLRNLNPTLGEEFYCLFEAGAIRIMENGKNS